MAVKCPISKGEKMIGLKRLKPFGHYFLIGISIDNIEYVFDKPIDTRTRFYKKAMVYSMAFRQLTKVLNQVFDDEYMNEHIPYRQQLLKK